MNRLRFILSLLVACAHLSAAAMLYAVHHDDEPIIGSGHAAIANHADAGNCHHIPISQYAQCALCASSVGRATVQEAPATMHPLQAAFLVPVAPVSFLLIPQFHSVLSHRGPPAF